MEIIEYKNEHFSEIKRWFNVRKIYFMLEANLMPQHGAFIVLHNKEPIAFGALVLTSSSVGILSHMITNPDFNKIKTGKAIKSLLATLDLFAKKSGCQISTCITQSKSISNLLYKFGYTRPKEHYICSRRTDLEV